MLLREYRKHGGVSLADMLVKLKAVAAPGELDKMRRSTILRHESGEHFPAARMQALYALATNDAVLPGDHVAVRREWEAKQELKEGAPNAAT
jgi:hypothetical protein